MYVYVCSYVVRFFSFVYGQRAFLCAFQPPRRPNVWPIGATRNQGGTTGVLGFQGAGAGTEAGPWSNGDPKGEGGLTWPWILAMGQRQRYFTMTLAFWLAALAGRFLFREELSIRRLSSLRFVVTWNRTCESILRESRIGNWESEEENGACGMRHGVWGGMELGWRTKLKRSCSERSLMLPLEVVKIGQTPVLRKREDKHSRRWTENGYFTHSQWHSK